ncbi:hypothetical protein Godav_006827, partial [Gossypium davidsonii]|nr:hypothetical protein [Gossypium davidsonii]MBA0673151.1 hypothetical protein [Gossypium klotzschianum]MBA0834734.1 hypothetical protein [Gossypium armourianum]
GLCDLIGFKCNTFTAKNQQNKATNSSSKDQRNKVGADGPLRLSDIK